MKFSAFFPMALALMVAVAPASPEEAWAGSREKVATQAKKKITKVAGKTSHKAAKKQKSQDIKHIAKTKKRDDAPLSERDIWLKRAQASDALTGKASWYGKDFHNKATACGLTYDMHTFTAAHRTLPLGTVVKVTDQHNGKSVMVCVTDRGPYVKGRIIDVSAAAATQLDLKRRGVGNVRLEVVSDETGAPLKKDSAYFVRYASGSGKSMVGPFKGFADAAAMHEALRQAHPDAEVVLESGKK